MNEKIEQCKKDIAALQAELKRLENETKPKPRHGDIVQYDLNGELCLIVIAEGDTLRAYSVRGRLECGSLATYDVAYCYEHGYYTVIGNVFGQETR